MAWYSKKDDKIAIGIDFGTENSCIAAYINDKVEILSDSNGNKSIPSFLAFTGKEFQVGKENLTIEAANKIFNIKRIIGRKYDDIQEDLKYYPFEIVKDGDFAKIKVMNKLYDPHDLSTLIFKNLKDIAEKKLGKKIKDVFIAVPAQFNDAQRQAVMKSANKADLNVEQLISEPSATALSFRHQNKNFPKDRNLLVFDLGAGTFDVSILKINANTCQTLSTSGNSSLGGQDFVNRLFDHLVEKFKKDFHIDLNDYKNDSEKLKKLNSKLKLRERCRKAKHLLSEVDNVLIAIENFYDDIDYLQLVTRDLFKKLNQNLLEKIKKSVQESLKGAKLECRQIDDVVLIGGGTKIIIVQELMKELFKNSGIIKKIDIERAVAFGAALEASKKFKVIEVTPFSLGIETKGNIFSIILNRNSPIPVSNTENYYTVSDNQTEILVKVYEGENKNATDNNLLGEFIITDIPKLPKGKAKIKVTFAIDKNGILVVTAVDAQTNNKKSIEINYGKGRMKSIK